MLKKTLVRMAGTTFYSGYLTPKAPGTVGSAVAVLFFLLLRAAGLNALWLHGLLVVATFGLSVWSGSHAGEYFGGQADPKELNMDEVCGQLIALLPITLHGRAVTAMLILSFLLFRGFDIFKPFPASFFDRKVKGGFGITMDDVVAGIYAFLILETVYRLALSG